MNQGKTETIHPKDKGQTPMVIVHAEQINETTTICLPTE